MGQGKGLDRGRGRHTKQPLEVTGEGHRCEVRQGEQTEAVVTGWFGSSV